MAPSSDNQLLNFLSTGYITVQPGAMSAADHKRLWTRADELYAAARKLESPTAHLELLGDNLRACIPEIDQMLNDPAVSAAVRNILGEDAFLHPHNFLHESLTQDQPFHQDGNLPWNERGHYRSHRPDWLIMFYYPQAVTLDNGPTEVIPGSQYWTTDIENEDGSWRPGDPIDPDLKHSTLRGADLAARDEALAASVEKLGIPGLQRCFVEVPAGSVVLGNYDLMHRGSRTRPGQAPRYMFKFYYARTREPEASGSQTAGSMPSAANPQQTDRVHEDLAPVIAANLAWTRGVRYRAPLDPVRVAAEDKHLREGGEHKKVAAAYRLGADTGAQSLNVLLQGLHDAAESVRRASAYGLRQRCDEAADALIKATRDERASVRRFAAFALGAAWSPGTDALIERLQGEADDLARSNAAYALGQISRSPAAESAKILAALSQRLQPGVEPDNTEAAGLSRSTVRQSVAYAVLLLAANHSLSDAARSEMAALLQTEPDRYVLGMLAEGLARGSADGEVIRALNARRWSAAR